MKYPLCVDLDGTLIRTNILLENILSLVKKSPYKAVFIPLWLLGGKAYFKEKLAEYGDFNAAHLPYNLEIIKFLQKSQENGQELVLATGADAASAQKIADELNIFSQIISSQKDQNATGKQKAKILCERFGEKGFDYAGNSFDDLDVFVKARKKILVSDSKNLKKKVQNLSNIDFFIRAKQNDWKIFLKAIRAHQWVKNILVFLPILAAHEYFNFSLMLKTLIAFFAYCLVASGVYLFNDLLDLSSDRNNPQKKHRPLASGALRIDIGMIAAPVFWSLGLLISLTASLYLALALGAYLIANIFYTLHFRKIAILDITFLALMYCFRVFVGSIATGIIVSEWMLMFSLFLFFSLAAIKRYAEVLNNSENNEAIIGRAYFKGDENFLLAISTMSGFLSVLIFALYLSSPSVSVLYPKKWLLWFICPVLIYWVSRIGLIARRGQMHHDPVVFAFKDLTSHGVAFLCASIILCARYL